MSLVYSIVARGKTVLAEWSDSTGNFTTVTRMLLARIGGDEFDTPRRQKSQMVSYMYDGKYVFHCLEPTAEISLRFLVMTEKIAGIRMPYKFLLHVRQAFISKYGFQKPLRSVALAYSDAFGSTMKDLHGKYNDCIEKGIEELPGGGGVDDGSLTDLMRVREQVDAIQNVMVENIDEILARSDKIDILVNRAESIMENTFEFRRQVELCNDCYDSVAVGAAISKNDVVEAEKISSWSFCHDINVVDNSNIN